MGQPLPPGEFDGDTIPTGDEMGDQLDNDPGGRPGIMGVLLHTQPPLSVRETAEKLDVSEPVAHYVVASRKALDSLTDTESGAGTSVIEHIIVGSVGFVTDRNDEREQPAEPEPNEDETEIVAAEGGMANAS